MYVTIDMKQALDDGRHKTLGQCSRPFVDINYSRISSSLSYLLVQYLILILLGIMFFG